MTDSQPDEHAEPNTHVIFGDRYLRNRPFLVVYAINRPAADAKTHVKGWADAPRNWRGFERPYVVDRITDKMMREACVIVDLLNKKLVKTQFGREGENLTLQHYMGKYSSQITEGVQIWAKQTGLDEIAKNAQVVPEIK